MADRQADVLVAVAPLAGAIGLFGVIYGAAAREVFGPTMTIATSVLVFSGAVQFTVAGLALGGASPLALFAAAALVNSRNLALGAMLRPHLLTSPLRRAGLATFVIDEVVGLALARREEAARTLVVAGAVCYLAWLAGTVAGVLGGALVPGIADLAAALFPVLFVALAALATDSLAGVGRALLGAALTVALALLLPDLRALAPVIAAVAVALPRHNPGGHPPDPPGHNPGGHPPDPPGHNPGGHPPDPPGARQ